MAESTMTLYKIALVREETLAEAKEYDGFNSLAFEQQIIGLDEIEINIYYDRISYDFYIQKNINIAGIISPNKEQYRYGEEINLEIISIRKGYKFLYWDLGSLNKQYDLKFNYVMPDCPVYLSVKFEAAYERIGNKIYLGTYPQSEVTNTDLIYELNQYVSKDDLNSWNAYEFYDSWSLDSYIYYKDIDVDNDDLYDYRAVLLKDYRPYRASHSKGDYYSYQDDNGYELDTIYWFKFETIEWLILKEENNQALIIANIILDSMEYQTVDYSGSNNYENSKIRQWLNEVFYNTVFEDYQKEVIKLTEVDNSLESTGLVSNTNICPNTNDYVFLLSHSEVDEYIDRSNLSSTSYAKCMGIYENEYICWTRSPDSLLRKALRDDYDIYTSNDVDWVYGIRPCVVIDLIC